VITCYRCGKTGHARSDCPRNNLAVAAEPIPDHPVPPRRPAQEVADTEAWAASIRARMGWHRGTETQHTPDRRELALCQVAESRRAREAGGL